MNAIRVRRGAGHDAGELSVQKRSRRVKRVRLTVYTTEEKDYALRYLALRRRKSLNQLVNENLDLLLQSSGIDPDTLPEEMPGKPT
jgi:hypothetical protein